MSTDADQKLLDPFLVPDEEIETAGDPVDPNGGPYDTDGNPIPPKK